jgi:hypothetical protein
MSRAQQPHDVARHFFQTLMQSQCHVCWNLFSNKTQSEFIKWTLRDIYTRNQQAAQTAKLGPAEIKIMFETNDMSLMRSFWRRFLQQSRAVEFLRFGYFKTVEVSGRQANVEANLVYPDGTNNTIVLKMYNERGGWKFGYLESGMTF